jgi:DNA-binding MarR family transcriptional regulator
MNHWIIRLRFPANPGAEFYQLIPAQRAIVDRLLRRGIIRSYTLSADRRNLWIIVRAEDEDTMQRVLEKLPLTEFANIHVEDILFHLAAEELFPEPSLN